MTKLILASASPRRQQLLAQIGVVPDAIEPANIDETPRPGERPRVYVERMGLEKVKAIHQDGQFTLAGDTVVALGRRVLPKTETNDEVEACLGLLSGRSHQVMTSVVLCGPDGPAARRLSVTRVQVKRLSRVDINTYLECEEGIGKAGGYAIQGQFGACIKRISGSYTGVMGLPVFETAQMLTGLGYRL